MTSLALAVAKCTEDNSHAFSVHALRLPGARVIPAQLSLFTPFFTIGGFAFTKPMLLALVCMRSW